MGYSLPVNRMGGKDIRGMLTKKMHLVAVLLLVIGGLNWGMQAIFKIDAVSSLLGKDTLLTRGVFTLVALAAIYIGFSRDTYLPFLGETVMPCSVLKEKIPDNADLKVRIMAPHKHKVIYWAAEPSDANDKLKAVKNWKDAYGDYNNIGVAIAEEDGSALLHVRKPQPYWVPPGKKLQPHIHYRICGEGGLLGPVRSLFIEERLEGFGSAFHL